MPVKYDEFVKKPHQEFEYEPWMIEEMEKCANNPHYFFRTYVLIQHPDKGKIKMNLYPHQKRMLRTIDNGRMTIIKTPRQYGKSSFCAAYILWYCCFNFDKTSGVVSNKQSSSIEILDRFKTMYESLPVWLKPGATNYAKTMVSFDNGCRVIASATSKNSFRGWTINGVCLCDEFCHVSKNLQNEFWSSNYPTVSASKEAKMILISTPLGMYDLFYNIWVKAEKEKSIFKCVDVHWSEHPERDEEWLKEQKEILGTRLFNQEVLCQFLGSTNTVIDAEELEKLFTCEVDPKVYELNDKLRVWEKPKENQKYVIGVDSAKGTGEHYSTIQVLKITGYNPFKAEQVAVFQDNHTDIYEFSNIVYKTSVYFNNAHIMCENNAEGSTVTSKIWWDFEYENLVNEGQKSTQLGIRATTKTKPKAVLAMKRLIENGDLLLKDRATIQELTSFVDFGNGKFAGKDLPDDLVSALYWACYIIEFDVFDEETGIKVEMEEDDIWGILSDTDDFSVVEDDFSWLNDIRI